MKLSKRFTAPAVTLALFAAVFGVVPMNAQENGPKITIPLAQSGKMVTQSAALLQIEGHVEVVKTQPSVKDGMRLTVVLTNRGDAPVRLLDPEEVTRVLLFDAEGWPIEVPVRPSRALTHSRDRGDDPAVITIEPGQAHRVDLQIREVLPRDTGEPGMRTPVPIVPGAYDVKVMSTLIAPAPPEGGRGASRTLQSEQFTVHLGV